MHRQTTPPSKSTTEKSDHEKDRIHPNCLKTKALQEKALALDPIDSVVHNRTGSADLLSARLLPSKPTATAPNTPFTGILFFHPTPTATQGSNITIPDRASGGRPGVDAPTALTARGKRPRPRVRLRSPGMSRCCADARGIQPGPLRSAWCTAGTPAAEQQQRWDGNQAGKTGDSGRRENG